MKKLFEILDKWKYQYLAAAVFLVLSMGLRMLEPKVLQIAVDRIINFFVAKNIGQGAAAMLFRAIYSVFSRKSK